jgi:hypothetical protein
VARSLRSKRRTAKIILTVSILGGLYGAYFTLFYGWLTATPIPPHRLVAVQRLCYVNFWFAATAFLTAIVAIVYLLKTRNSSLCSAMGNASSGGKA